MTDYLIIGSGVAGIAAVEAIRSQDQHSGITLISNEQDGFYSRPGLAYYLTGELTEANLKPFSKRFFDELRCRRLHAEVSAIIPSQSLIQLQDGTQIPYKCLLIATGAQAARMDIRGLT